MFHAQFKIMCILLVLDGMFCRYLLNPSGLMCYLKPVFSYEFSVWMIPLTLCRWNDEVPHCSFLKKKNSVFVKGVDEFKKEIILLLILCTFQFC